MKEQTQALVKKFEQDYEIYISATDALTYWIIHARVPKSHKEGLHHLHLGKKYVSGPNQEGNVLIISDPERSDAYTVESWGTMESIDDFVRKALARILSDRNAPEAGQECCADSNG